MKVHILFGVRKEDYPGQYGTEARLAWDEYCIEENPEGWAKAVEEERKLVGDDMQAMKVVVLDVDEDRIRKLVVGDTPVVKARIDEAGTEAEG